MNLLTKTRLKLTKVLLPEIKFENFYKNYNRNAKIINANAKIIYDDYMKWVSIDDGINEDMRDALKNQSKNLENALLLCNQSFLAPTLVNAVAYTKFYTLFYLNTEEGKTDKNFAKILTRLGFVLDDVAFEVVRYFINNEELFINFDKKNLSFETPVRVENENVLRLSLKVMNYVGMTQRAIYEEDINKIKDIFNNFELSDAIDDCSDLFAKFGDTSELYEVADDYEEDKEDVENDKNEEIDNKTV